MKEMVINGTNKRVIIDDEDFDEYSKWKWNHIRGYAKRSTRNTTLSLHRLIMNAEKGQKVLFKNKNTLDCRKKNLKIGTQKEATRRRIRRKDSSSKYKGVRLNGEYIQANIKVDGKQIYLGSFETQELAALAYNEAAKKYFGKSALLNSV